MLKMSAALSHTKSLLNDFRTVKKEGQGPDTSRTGHLIDTRPFDVPSTSLPPQTETVSVLTEKQCRVRAVQIAARDELTGLDFSILYHFVKFWKRWSVWGVDFWSFSRLDLVLVIFRHRLLIIFSRLDFACNAARAGCENVEDTSASNVNVYCKGGLFISIRRRICTTISVFSLLRLASKKKIGIAFQRWSSSLRLVFLACSSELRSPTRGHSERD